MVVYQIKNCINNKRYIGQTIQSIEKRFKEHCKPSQRMLICCAIRKYGKENFTIEIIDQGESLDDLNNKEAFWIQFLNTISPNGYNLDSGGGNKVVHKETKLKLSKAHKGKILSEDHKQKLSESHKGFVQSCEQRRKNSESHKGDKNHFYGQKHSEETRKRMSDSAKGRTYSLEQRIKISNKLKGKLVSEETKKKMSESMKESYRSRREALENKNQKKLFE